MDSKPEKINEANRPPQKLSPEERRERYAQMRAKLGRSKIKVDAPDGVTAMWALKDNEFERARMDWLGFRVVVEDMKPGAKKRFSAAGLKLDGTYVMGDVILMEIDTETWELQKQIELDDFEQLRSNISEEFRDKAKTAGKVPVPTFEVNEKNEKVFTK